MYIIIECFERQVQCNKNIWITCRRWRDSRHDLLFNKYSGKIQVCNQITKYWMMHISIEPCEILWNIKVLRVVTGPAFWVVILLRLSVTSWIATLLTSSLWRSVAYSDRFLELRADDSWDCSRTIDSIDLILL